MRAYQRAGRSRDHRCRQSRSYRRFPRSGRCNIFLCRVERSCRRDLRIFWGWPFITLLGAKLAKFDAAPAVEDSTRIEISSGAICGPISEHPTKIHRSASETCQEQSRTRPRVSNCSRCCTSLSTDQEHCVVGDVRGAAFWGSHKLKHQLFLHSFGIRCNSRPYGFADSRFSRKSVQENKRAIRLHHCRLFQFCCCVRVRKHPS